MNASSRCKRVLFTFALAGCSNSRLPARIYVLEFASKLVRKQHQRVDSKPRDSQIFGSPGTVYVSMVSLEPLDVVDDDKRRDVVHNHLRNE